MIVEDMNSKNNELRESDNAMDIVSLSKNM